MMVGTGRAACHHGEVLQGVFHRPGGLPCRGLVTLPSPRPRTRATFVPDRECRFAVHPPSRTKALEAARLTVAECARITGRPRCGGGLRIGSTIPVGLGMGSSTSDAIAAVRAVAASFGARLAPTEVARLTVAAEHASDPLMLDGRPRLFAQREGRVLEDLGDALPPAVVVGCLTGGGIPVDTLRGTPRSGCGDVLDEDLTAFEVLRDLLRRAVAESDTGLLGRVCTASARRNQRVLAKEELPELERLADRFGAAGVQVAHSGNVAGLLFDPAAPGAKRRLRQCARALRRSGIPLTRVFRLPASRTETAHGRAHRRDHRPPRTPAPRRPFDLPAF